MERFDFTDKEDGYYRIESNGANLHLWVRDGAVTEISVHGETPGINIFTTSKMSKKTTQLKDAQNDCIILKVKELVQR